MNISIKSIFRIPRILIIFKDFSQGFNFANAPLLNFSRLLNFAVPPKFAKSAKFNAREI